MKTFYIVQSAPNPKIPSSIPHIVRCSEFELQKYLDLNFTITGTIQIPSIEDFLNIPIQGKSLQLYQNIFGTYIFRDIRNIKTKHFTDRESGVWVTEENIDTVLNIIYNNN
jgi:hypothetical protein